MKLKPIFLILKKSAKTYMPVYWRIMSGCQSDAENFAMHILHIDSTHYYLSDVAPTNEETGRKRMKFWSSGDVHVHNGLRVLKYTIKFNLK